MKMSHIALGLMAGLWSVTACTPAGEPASQVTAAFNDPESWRSLLGGDNPDRGDLRGLDGETDLTVDDFAVVSGVVRELVSAGATGQGRNDFHGVPDPGEGCGSVAFDAVSAYANGSGVRAVVVWRGDDCPSSPPQGWPQVMFFDLDEQRRPIVTAGGPSGRLAGMLSPLECADPGVSARVELAAVWNELCRHARENGFPLRAVDGHRTVAQQEELFDIARDQWGDLAPYKVEPVTGGECQSAHCRGEAIDVDDATLEWLRQPVCDGQSCIERMTAYGFHTPLVHSPHHLESVVAFVDARGRACGTAVDTAAVIFQQWVCELRTLGLSSRDVEVLSDRAVKLAACLSGLDPAHVNGTRSGVFSLGDEVRRWAGDVTGDVVGDASVAARLYVSERQWGLSGFWSLDPDRNCTP